MNVGLVLATYKEELNIKELLNSIFNNLNVSIDGKKILDDFNISINEGEVHAIMGPNGCGKSTLANVLAGNEDYEVNSG